MQEYLGDDLAGNEADVWKIKRLKNVLLLGLKLSNRLLSSLGLLAGLVVLAASFLPFRLLIFSSPKSTCCRFFIQVLDELCFFFYAEERNIWPALSPSQINHLDLNHDIFEHYDFEQDVVNEYSLIQGKLCACISFWQDTVQYVCRI